MSNLRLIKLKATDSSTIKAKFTHEVDPFINANNVSITVNTPGVPECKILEVVAHKDILVITTRPMTPYAVYLLKFVSTNTIKFKSKDGSAYLPNDDSSNQNMFFGPEDPEDPIRSFLLEYLKDNIYDTNKGTLISDAINAQASLLSKAFYDARQLYSENYLTVLIENELKTRGAGPYDRLIEEGAYEIVRVGRGVSGTTSSTSYSFTSFPSTPITLQSIPVKSEKLEAGIGFDGLVFTVNNNYVTKLSKVLIAYQGGGSATYNLSKYGYQIKEPRYDSDIASPYYLLNENQFKLSDAILDTDFITPKSGDIVYVDYEYKNLGRFVDSSTIAVTQVLKATREVTPPSITQFTLKNSPITTSANIVQTFGGVVFLDPESNPPFSQTHPAFSKEIPFKIENLPKNPGEYSVEYLTGRVFVYGESVNDGTGDYPPVATYNYRKSYTNKLDYTYDSSASELVANQTRFLIGEKASVSFSYEDALVPGVDYKANVHEEIINERIQSNLRSVNSLFTLKSPITNVFRIYNETSGEIYKVQRWSNNAVYFDYTIPPNISAVNREKVKFTTVNNELLTVASEIINTNTVRVFKITLANNRIINASEDAIGSSFNSSVLFSRTDIFENEIYFDWQTETETTNINKLTSVGQYEIDYSNGIIYVVVLNDQNFDLGTINYKKPVINPDNPHVISVSEIYFSLDSISGINKRVSYLSIGESAVVPETFDLSDERFISGNELAPFVYDNGAIKVTDDIKDVRGVYDLYDLNNNVNPINFAADCSISANIITLNITGVKQEYVNTISGLTVNVPFVTNSAEIVGVKSVIRTSDGAELWDNTGTYSAYQITLPGINGTAPGDEVTIIYYLGLNGSSTPVVDYSRGDYYIDYTYLADEILISYEYGDNNIDFRETDSISEGQTYFVTYKIGALRDSLLRNFGSLIDIPILNELDVSLNRENYRDAIKAVLQAFTKGPTIPALKSIASNIAHMEPEIIEAAFMNWSLGSSMLYPSKISTTGDIQLHVGKFDYGALIKNADETISFPMSSNLKLSDGTFETWVTTEWDGLDNDATLTFSINKNGALLDASNIYIGSDSHNPVYDSNNKFSVNRMDEISPVGLPAKIYTETGVFIYYDSDVKRWKVLARDNVVGSNNNIYSGEIISSGEVYDTKFIPGLGEVNDVIRSGSNSIYFEFHLDSQDAAYPDGYEDGYNVIDGYYPLNGYVAGYSFDGIHFMADDEHYIFDSGETETTNRLSIYKDGRGYLNFRVYDRGNGKDKTQYKVSSDISSWSAGEKHHIATSWVLNSSDRRDEMHLFIDGIEVPNIMRFGGRPSGTSTDRFRTVKPEYVVGLITKKVLTYNDLITNSGSNVVSSTLINFQNEGIVPGDTITILEQGFGTYNITNVSSNQLTLDSAMLASLTDARFSINEFSSIVTSEIDCVSNFAVCILHNGTETEIPGLRADIPGYSVSKNMLGQNVLTLLGNADVGDQIVIRTLGLNHRRYRDKVFVWGNNTNVLRTNMAPPMSLDEVKITALLLPLIHIGPDNSTVSFGTFTSNITDINQPTSSSEGRTLLVRITGQNVLFSSPASVTINGTTQAGPLFETLLFSSATSQATTNKFLTITSVDVIVTPINVSINSVGVEIKEEYPITYSEGNESYPVIRYSYKTQYGTSLESVGGDTVFDRNGFFPQSSVGQSLVIQSPGPPIAGTYTITEKVDNSTVKVSPNVPSAFTSGVYNVYNTSIGRSGFQNGFFTLELAGATNTPYPLPQGWYEFDYSAYLEIPLDPINPTRKCFVGSDINGNKQVKAILDELRILSTKLTDVRVGESISDNQMCITTDYNELRPFDKNSNTLVLLHMNSLPFVNSADVWVGYDKSFIQSTNSVNSNFEQSVVLTENPLVIDNAGLLDTSSEFSIEFWVSPRYDTYNDPNFRFYFDASGSVIDEVNSLSSVSVKVNNRIDSVIGVYLANDKLLTTNYFAGASIASDGKTINLKKPLPYQNVSVKVNYVPAGLNGDRISIFKDREGFITLNVRSNGDDYQVRQPVFWSRDTWHRVRATFKLNRQDNKDEIRLFVDGEERGIILFGQGLLFSQDVIFSQGFAGVNNTILTADINFKDPINQFYIGSDYMKLHKAYARMDNLRISNVARKSTYVAGQPFDINYSSNSSIVYPVVEDVFTTYLLNFDSLIKKETDFALLKNSNFGIFDFIMNVNDSFGIISGNAKIKQIFTNLILALKPGQSRVTLNYLP